MQASPWPEPPVRIANRIRAFLLHVPYYSIEGQRRLARDCGVSPSTISRLVRGETTPSYPLAARITQAISRRMGVPVDVRDVFSIDGSSYPTACVCDVTPNCKGCFPPEAYADDGTMLAEYRDLKPGDWCRFLPIDPQVGLNTNKS